MSYFFSNIARFLDSVESFILNYSRRVITFIFLIILIIGSISVLYGLVKIADNPNITESSVFEAPEFKRPIKIEVEEEKEQIDEEADTKDDKKWTHPMPEYKSELNNISESLMPFYAVFIGWEGSEKNYQYLIDNIASTVSPYKKNLNEDQFEEVIEGLEDYIQDKSSWMREDLRVSKQLIIPVRINPNNLPELVIPDEIVQEFLSYPFKDYFILVNDAYQKNLEDADMESAIAEMNRANGGVILLYGSVLLSSCIILIFLLIIFKSENSLRRSADSIEKLKQ